MTSHQATSGIPRLPEWDQGERLRKARKTRGYTTDDIAAHLGCSERTVRNYEVGATRPNRATLMAWAAFTDVPLSWLEDDLDRGLTAGYATELVAV